MRQTRYAEGKNGEKGGKFALPDADQKDLKELFVFLQTCLLLKGLEGV